MVAKRSGNKKWQGFFQKPTNWLFINSECFCVAVAESSKAAVSAAA
jgi:hypothetical protein